MSTTRVYRDFKALTPLRSLFRRKQHRILDANLHHGDIRPFACPELLCEGQPSFKKLYPLRECECLGFADDRDVVQGFCNDSHFFVEGGFLREATSKQLCAGESCLGGVPAPETAPVLVGECANGFGDKTRPDTERLLFDASPDMPCGISAASRGTCSAQYIEVLVRDVRRDFDVRDLDYHLTSETDIPMGGVCTGCSNIVWTQRSGPSATITDASTANAKFTPTTAGLYEFEVTFTKNGSTVTRVVQRAVGDPPVGVQPTVSPGGDLTGQIDSPVTLSGSITTDTGVGVTRAGWVQVAGPATATISGSNVSGTNVTASATFPEPGVYTFALAVVDENNQVAHQEIQITIADSSLGVDAGAYAQYGANAVVSLSGVLGPGVSGLWSQESGPNVVLTNPTTLTPTFTPTEEGVYVFKLTGTKSGAKEEDTTTIVITEQDLGSTLNGSGPVVTGENGTIILTSDPTGAYDDIHWTLVEGDEASFATPGEKTTSVVVGDVGTYIFKVTVCKRDPAIAGQESQNAQPYERANEVDLSCADDTPDVDGSVYAVEADGACDAVEMFYVVTYVSKGVESAPSPISNGVVVNTPIGIQVSWGAVPDGWCIDEVRVYRSESGFEDGASEMPNLGAEWSLVGSFPSGTLNFTDSSSSSMTTDPLTTHDPMLFPAPDGVQLVARTEDGLVVADSNRVYISYPGRAMFSWDGVVEINDTIRGIAAIGNAILIVTDNYPVHIRYSISDGPLQISRTTIPVRAPLTSKASMSVWGGKLIFASTYALYMWDAILRLDGPENPLQRLLSPEQWKNIDPNTVRGTAYELGYMMSSDALPYALMFEFEEGRDDTLNLTSAMPITYAKAEAYATDKDGHIVFHRGGNTYRWDWRRDTCNADVQEQGITNPCERCCPWTVELYHDFEGKNRHHHMRVEWDERSGYEGIKLTYKFQNFGRTDALPVQVITSSRGFGIPREVSTQTYSAELTGCAIMHEVRTATSRSELAGVAEDDGH